MELLPVQGDDDDMVYFELSILVTIMMTMTHMCRDPKELHKNIDTTGSVDQLDYLEQVGKILFRYIANMTFVVLSIFINESFTVPSWVGH